MKQHEPVIKPQFFKQNLYALKLLWQLSAKRVIFDALNVLADYAIWLFSSIFFVRHIIHSVDTGRPFNDILIFIVISAIILGLDKIFKNYKVHVVDRLTNNTIKRDLYALLYRKAANVELGCYEDSSFYDNYTMALENAGTRVPETVSTFFWIIGGILGSMVAFYVMFTIDPFSVFFIFFPIIGNFYFGGLLSKIEAKRYAETTPYKRKIDYVKRVLYLAEFAKEVRMSNIYTVMMRRYDEGVKGTQAVANRYAPRAVIFQTLKLLLSFAFVFQGIMIYGAYLALVRHTLELADMTIIFTAMVSTSWIFIGLFSSVSESLKHVVFINYLRVFLGYTELIPENQDGVMPSADFKSLQFNNVSFQYKTGEYAIKNVSFTIEYGEIAAFVGHNGAGKTTLTKLLFRLYDPTEGEILLNGINIKDYNLKAYRQLFAAAFQDFKLFSLTVADNVYFNPHTILTKEQKQQVIHKALDQAGVLDEISKQPHGIASTLTKEFDDEGVVLSGGNAQKVVVARAFAKDAPIGVYDEPSSALDPIAEYDLYQSIIKNSAGRTTLFISHRLSSVADADVIFVMEQGELIEQGSHRTLMNEKGAYEKMYTLQARSYLAVEEDVAL